MHALSPARVLIVAHQTADSVELAAAVRAACSHRLLHLCAAGADSSPRTASGSKIRRITVRGSGRSAPRRGTSDPFLTPPVQNVDGIVGSHEPLAAVQDALNLLGFDEVIVSTSPATAAPGGPRSRPAEEGSRGTGGSGNARRPAARNTTLTDVPAA